MIAPTDETENNKERKNAMQNEELEIIRMSEIQMREVEWLWYPYIPFGKLTIIQGDPGEGKTTFALRLAAACSTGTAMPGMESLSPFNVIYQSAEDGLEDTIKPRLTEAGADQERVINIREDKKSLHLLDSRIEKAIVRCDAKLLILDPLQGYLGERIDMNRANEIREVMKAIGQVAQRTGCAIVLVGHLNKATGMSSAYRGLGSIKRSCGGQTAEEQKYPCHHLLSLPKESPLPSISVTRTVSVGSTDTTRYPPRICCRAFPLSRKPRRCRPRKLFARCWRTAQRYPARTSFRPQQENRYLAVPSTKPRKILPVLFHARSAPNGCGRSQMKIATLQRCPRMKNENRCKKHRHFCIVALFFPLPTETNRGADHRPVSHTNALCALFRGRTGKHTKGQIFPFFCRCCGNERKAGLRFCTLSLERVRASHSTGRGAPAPCLLRSCLATRSAGRSPAPTHFLWKESKQRNFKTERSIYF